MNQHLKLKLTGIVQGVNLRSMVKVKALTLGLVGYVMNNNDGSVTIEAEASREKLIDLMNWLSNLFGYCRVNHISDEWSEPNNQSNEFQIKY